MTDFMTQITDDLRGQIQGFEPQVGISDIGSVMEAGDGIARLNGLPSIRSQELVQFANGMMGIAFNLEKESVGVIIMGDYAGITEGMTARGTGRIASVPVGDALIGRVVNALGQPVDAKGPIASTAFRIDPPCSACRPSLGPSRPRKDPPGRDRARRCTGR